MFSDVTMKRGFASPRVHSALGTTLVDTDLEGIVAKHLADAYHPKLARWYKVINASYTQHRGRGEWFLERRGCPVRNAIRASRSSR